LLFELPVDELPLDPPGEPVPLELPSVSPDVPLAEVPLAPVLLEPVCEPVPLAPRLPVPELPPPPLPVVPVPAPDWRLLRQLLNSSENFL
jgi:hypothetical protein